MLSRDDDLLRVDASKCELPLELAVVEPKPTGKVDHAWEFRSLYEVLPALIPCLQRQPDLAEFEKPER